MSNMCSVMQRESGGCQLSGLAQNDNWEMNVEGHHGFERSYTLVGEAGEHQPEAIRNVLIKLLPASTR